MQRMKRTKKSERTMTHDHDMDQVSAVGVDAEDALRRRMTQRSKNGWELVTVVVVVNQTMLFWKKVASYG
jgi:hypothetical protein